MRVIADRQGLGPVLMPGSADLDGSHSWDSGGPLPHFWSLLTEARVTE